VRSKLISSLNPFYNTSSLIFAVVYQWLKLLDGFDLVVAELNNLEFAVDSKILKLPAVQLVVGHLDLNK
jgi:hypothetical protein